MSLRLRQPQPSPDNEAGAVFKLSNQHELRVTVMADESDELRKVLTPAQRKERDANRKFDAEQALIEIADEKKAFDENRERLKAERLARERERSK